MRRVHNLWVVLHTSHLLSDAFHRRDRSTSRRCSHGEALRCLVHGITVGHPDLVACFQTFVQNATGMGDFGAAVFTVTGLRNVATQGMVRSEEHTSELQSR